jgi:hypothetical protein
MDKLLISLPLERLPSSTKFINMLKEDLEHSLFVTKKIVENSLITMDLPTRLTNFWNKLKNMLNLNPTQF